MSTVHHDIPTAWSARVAASVFCTLVACTFVVGCKGSGQGTGVGSGPAAPSAAATPPAAIPASSPRATVWLFISTDCPICNGYQPEIERLRMRFAPRGIEFVGVYAEVPLERSEMEAHVAKYGMKYPVRIDTDRAIQQRMGVRMVPEVVVTAGAPESAGNTAAFLYRGRIDDQWPERGSRRPSATVHDLERALEAIVAGQQPAVRITTPVGCVL
jgi:hypothetical protein